MSGATERHDGWQERLRDRLLLDGAPEVEHIVGNDTEPDPAVHPNVALVAASSEAVAPLDHADASFRPGAPFLTVAEPALPLLALALGALGRAIGNADALDAFRLRGRLIPERVECGIRCHQTRRAAEQRLMCLDRGDQQVRVHRAAEDRLGNR